MKKTFLKHRELIIIQWKLTLSYDNNCFFFSNYAKSKKQNNFVRFFDFDNYWNIWFKRFLSLRFFCIKQHIVLIFFFSKNIDISNISHDSNDFCRHDIFNIKHNNNFFFDIISSTTNLNKFISNKNLFDQTIKSIEFYVKIDVFEMIFLCNNRVFLICRHLSIVFQYLHFLNFLNFFFDRKLCKFMTLNIVQTWQRFFQFTKNRIFNRYHMKRSKKRRRQRFEIVNSTCI